MEKMLVTQGLNELKLLNSRIQNAIDNSMFVISAKEKDSKVNPNLTKADFEECAKAAYQSVNDLIERRKRIKAAIVASNAATRLTIAGEEMTVAEAIERKNTIEYEEQLLKKMQNQLNAQIRDMNIHNIELEEKIDDNIKTIIAKDSTKGKDDEELKMITDMMCKKGQYALVDPLNLEKKIEDLNNKIRGFKSEVDAALQISNCITYIEF